jgi:hypothetical protein
MHHKQPIVVSKHPFNFSVTCIADISQAFLTKNETLEMWPRHVSYYYLCM